MSDFTWPVPGTPGAIVWSDVTSYPAAPARLSTVDPAWQLVMLELANTFLDVRMTGGEEAPATRMARVLYVLHLYALDIMAGTTAASGAAGPLSQESAGKLSRQYGSLDRAGGGMNNEPLGMTIYGRALLALVWPLTRARVLR